MSAPSTAQPPFRRNGTAGSRGLTQTKRGLSKHSLMPDQVGRGKTGGSYISESLLKGSSGKPAEPKFLVAPSSSSHGPSPSQSPRESIKLNNIGVSNHSRRGLRNSTRGAGAFTAMDSIRRVSVTSMNTGSTHSHGTSHSGRSEQSTGSEPSYVGYLRTSFKGTIEARPAMCREVSGLDDSQASFFYDDSDDLSSMNCSSRMVEDDGSTLDMSCLDLPSCERPGIEMRMPKNPGERATSPAPLVRSPIRSMSRQTVMSPGATNYSPTSTRSPEPSRMSTRFSESGGVCQPPLITSPNSRRDASPPSMGSRRPEPSLGPGSTSRHARYRRSKTEPVPAGDYPTASSASGRSSPTYGRSAEPSKPAPYGRTKTDSIAMDRSQKPTAVFERSKTDSVSYAPRQEPPSYSHNPRASTYRNYEQQQASYSTPVPSPSRTNERRTFEDMAKVAQSMDGSSSSAAAEQEYEMEISPGVYMNFRGPQETWRAVEAGRTLESFCLECGLELVAVYDCKCIVCSDCNMVNPVFEHPSGVRPDAVHGAGIGLKKDLVIQRMAAAYY